MFENLLIVYKLARYFEDAGYAEFENCPIACKLASSVVASNADLCCSGIDCFERNTEVL